MRSTEKSLDHVPARLLEREFVRFVVVGATNTIISYLAYLLLLHISSYLVANAVSYAGGIALAYYLNARFVFHQPLRWRKAVQFPAVYVVQFVVSSVLLIVLVEWLGWDARLAPLLAIPLTIPFTFLVSRFILKPRGGP